jgi:hypothetical protein
MPDAAGKGKKTLAEYQNPNSASHCHDVEGKNQKSSKGSHGIELGIAKYVKVGKIMSEET